MGQRLVIANYTTDAEPTNAIYYHWSAYTDSALEELVELTDTITDYYEQLDNPVNVMTTKEEMITHFNLACLSAVSGIDMSDKKSLAYLKTIKPTYENNNVDRNEGMITFTETDIANCLSYSEGTLSVYWKFKDDGTPDFENTTYDLTELVNTGTANQMKSFFHCSINELNGLKNRPINYNLEDLPLDTIYTLAEELPSIWYDGYTETFRYKIE